MAQIIRSLSRVASRLLLILLIGGAGLCQGCSQLDSFFSDDSGPGSNPGIVEVAVTNTAPKSLSTGGLGYTSCKVAITGAEISPDGSNWFSVLELAGETVELASAADAMDRIHILGQKSFNVTEAFSKARVHLNYVFRDSTPSVNYTADPDNPLVTMPIVSAQADSYFTLAQGRTTLLYFDIDSSQEMTGIAGSGALSCEVRAMFTNICLFPYLDPESDKDGAWSNGTIYGYYHDTLLKDSTNTQIGTLAYQSETLTGNYLVSTGKWKGMKGTFEVYREAFAKYGRMLFVLNSGYDSGVWLSDQTKSEGYFSLNSIWPYARTGILVDTLGIQVGTMTLNDKLSFYKIAGDWSLTSTSETGKIYVH